MENVAWKKWFNALAPRAQERILRALETLAEFPTLRGELPDLESLRKVFAGDRQAQLWEVKSFTNDRKQSLLDRIGPEDVVMDQWEAERAASRINIILKLLNANAYAEASKVEEV